MRGPKLREHAQTFQYLYIHRHRPSLRQVCPNRGRRRHGNAATAQPSLRSMVVGARPPHVASPVGRGACDRGRMSTGRTAGNTPGSLRAATTTEAASPPPRPPPTLRGGDANGQMGDRVSFPPAPTKNRAGASRPLGRPVLRDEIPRTADVPAAGSAKHDRLDIWK